MHEDEESAEDLETLRQRIRSVDEDLLALAAERIRLAREIGEIKRRQERPTVDYAQERQVLERGRKLAGRVGLEGGVAEELLARLIRASVTVQEEDRLRQAATGEGKSAVVVGGAGRMGRWFGRFLLTQGWSVAVLDPPAAPDEVAFASARLMDADLVVSATPPRLTAEDYRRWSREPPRGVIVDLASIKTPILDDLRRLQEAGARLASIHPMFGPATVLLRDADVVICDTGDEVATAAVEDLFRPTTANLVRLPLEEHDRIMADLLSLGHAAAIAFALALPEAEHPVRSTTFQALESLAAAVVRESPDVYYEIQAKNPHSLDAVSKLREAVDRVLDAARRPDAQAFRSLMEEGQRRTVSAGVARRESRRQ